MLEINEVKIGNYVTNSKGDIFQITTGAFYLYHPNKEWDVLPIELTEEWLLRFGFEQLNKQPIYFIAIGSNIDFKIKLGVNIKGWFGICYDNLTFYGINDNKIQYIHQLQNLYFALTGHELVTK